MVRKNMSKSAMGPAEMIGRAECLRLLGLNCLGRVAFTQGALPAIRLVNYALVGTQVVVQTGADGLGRRLDGQVVAFEVDRLEEETSAGWSVVLTGTARVLRHPRELVRVGELPVLDAVPLTSSAGLGIVSMVCIAPGTITGHRFGSLQDTKASLSVRAGKAAPAS